MILRIHWWPWGYFRLLWFTDAVSGSGNTTAPMPSSAITGTSTYYVSQTTGNCESERIAIDVIINAPPIVTGSPVFTSASCGISNGSVTGLNVF